MMSRFNVTRRLSIPAVKAEFENGDKTELHESEIHNFQSITGSLQYLACWTRPDIAYATNRAAQGNAKPQQRHLEAAERILAYVNATSDYGLRYKKGRGRGQIEAYSDADFAEDTDTRKSTSGVLLQYAGGAIIWESHKQSNVAQSTTEAELYAINETARNILWAHRMLKTMTDKVGIITLRADNLAAIKVVSDYQFHKRIKYIDTRYLAVRDWINKGKFKIEYVG